MTYLQDDPNKRSWIDPTLERMSKQSSLWPELARLFFNFHQRLSKLEKKQADRDRAWDLTNRYAEHNAHLQGVIIDIEAHLTAFNNGSLSNPNKTMDELAERLSEEMSSWQAQDTW